MRNSHEKVAAYHISYCLRRQIVQSERLTLRFNETAFISKGGVSQSLVRRKTVVIQ